MKNWILFFALSFALTNGACEKKEQTVFEDTGKKMDQGMHNAMDKVDHGLNKAGEEIEKGLDKAGDKVKEATN